MQSATAEMQRALNTEPADTSDALGWTKLTVTRWRHGELHGTVAGMGEHVVMSYLRQAGRIERRNGGRCEAGVMRAGSVTIIPSGQEAHWDLEGSVEIVHAYLKPAVLASFAEENGVRVGPLRERLTFADTSGARLLELLASELISDGRRDRLFNEQLCSLLCMHLLRRHCEDVDRFATGYVRGGLARWQLARVTELAKSALSETLSLQQFADAVGLSSFHFARSFKAQTGVSPHSWLIELRMARAQELLSSASLPVGEIAAAVGYDDPSYFARLFKTRVGATPHAYRRNQRN